MTARFNDPTARPAARLSAEEWERQAPRRGAPLDPHGMAAKELHVRFNAWEHEHLQKLGRMECASMQRLVRTIVRAHLFERFGDPGK